MRKVRLAIEQLKVVSFETAGDEPRRGTVRAHCTNEQYTCELYCTRDCDHAVHTCDAGHYTCMCQDTAHDECTNYTACLGLTMC
jgi:hypothetical protein